MTEEEMKEMALGYVRYCHSLRKELASVKNEHELTLMEIDDWLMTQSKEVIASAPACIFTTRYVLADQ